MAFSLFFCNKEKRSFVISSQSGIVSGDMWLLFAFLSAFFAGLTTILAKCGIRKTDSTVATFIRTIVVLVFSWLMVFVVGAQGGITEIGPGTLLFLFLSGLSTGLSWLCYFKALEMGDINKVVPIDKSSTVITVILAFLFLGEGIGVWKGIGTAVMALGTFLMIEKKIGIHGIDSTLGTAVRTVVVLFMSYVVVAAEGKTKEIIRTGRKELFFIILSGFATGASWLCYYRALKEGDAGVVVLIDKLSIRVTVAFSFVASTEKLSRKSALGLFLVVSGTMMMLMK